MSLRKRCSRTAPPTLADGTENPFHCPTSPRCEHHWHYDFQVNRARYRNTTETADKHQARDIEARERARILEGRHGIRRQPDITFRQFAETYMRDHAEVHKRSAERDRYTLKILNVHFGALILHEITTHRIEQFKRERLTGRWRAHGQKGPSKPIKPATVNREVDTLKSILSKAVEWGKLAVSPARGIRRLKVDNARTRILTDDEQGRLLAAARPKLRAIILLALITGARIGELLTLRWEDVEDDALTFMETKNGRARRLPLSPAIAALLKALPRQHAYVFTNAQTGEAYTSVRHAFDRAVTRAGIMTGDVTLHTLRHTALSRMIADGQDDYTVMAVSGHSSTRMLARYTHPSESRKLDALATFKLPGRVTTASQTETASEVEAAEITELLKKVLVDAGRIELPTSALRTQRSPS